MMEKASVKEVEGAQSVRRAIAVLRMVASGQEHGLRLVDIENALGFTRATVHRLLSVLVAEGAVERSPSTRRYAIGPEIALLSLARRGVLPLQRIAENSLETLSNSEGETSFLTIRNGLDSVCIARHPGRYPIKVLAIDVGARRPLGMGVSGVVLLAALEEEEADRILRANAERLTATGLNPDEVRSAVSRARQDQYYFSRSGLIAGSRALSVPVLDQDGQTIAAVAVAAISDRLSDSRLPSMLSAVRYCSAAIGSAFNARYRGSQQTPDF